jgi:hypothetical protein
VALAKAKLLSQAWPGFYLHVGTRGVALGHVSIYTTCVGCDYQICSGKAQTRRICNVKTLNIDRDGLIESIDYGSLKELEKGRFGTTRTGPKIVLSRLIWYVDHGCVEFSRSLAPHLQFWLGDS